MAGTGGRSDIALIDLLFERPDRFEFVEAVRLLEQQDRLDRKAQASESDAAPSASGADLIRFRATMAVGFPHTEISAVRAAAENQTAEIDVCHIGLNGPSGVLPRFYSEWVQQQAKLRNTALRDFFDIFNDRAIRNHLDASRKYRLPAAFDAASGYHNPISHVVRAAIGMATAGLAGRLAFDDDVLLTYAGLLSRSVRTAAGLQDILSDFIGRPVQVEQLTGGWADLDRQDQTRLPTVDRREGMFAQLGVNAVLGERIFDSSGAFRLKIGPLGYGDFADLLPGSRLVQQVADLTRVYVGPSLAFEMQLTLERRSVPACVLGGADAVHPMLGLNTWLFSSAPSTDPADVVLRYEKI